MSSNTIDMSEKRMVGPVIRLHSHDNVLIARTDPDRLGDLGAVRLVNGRSRLVVDPERFTDDVLEPMAAVARAGPARPCLAIMLPSIAVTMVADSPGVFSRIDVVDPPNIAP